MKYRHLGTSGLLMSRVTLGTMTFGAPDWGCDEKAPRALITEYDEIKNIAYIKMTGKVDSKDILDALDRAVSSEKYKSGMGRLWDFTEIDLTSLASEVIAEMAQYSLQFPPGVRDVKVAFAVTKPLEYGLTHMFQAYSDVYAASHVMVFDTVHKAEAWMREDKDT
ncbi:hypothetical protein D3OALGB2SA_662 [Olavius algarvensis associated proteobacterium Delta 3]|nr:hypothetical protein D3OALGB2SA_662 [Olavius algarvensis associated proteobacterium Delta 3]